VSRLAWRLDGRAKLAVKADMMNLRWGQQFKARLDEWILSVRVDESYGGGFFVNTVVLGSRSSPTWRGSLPERPWSPPCDEETAC